MRSLYDLKTEMEIEERLLSSLKKRRNKLIKKQVPKAYPKGQSYVDADSIPGRSHIGFIEVVELLDDLDYEIEKTERNIAEIGREIDKLVDLINSLQGLEKKVKYMQMVEGKSLKEIALELGYSYGYIKNISMEQNKK